MAEDIVLDDPCGVELSSEELAVYEKVATRAIENALDAKFAPSRFRAHRTDIGPTHDTYSIERLNGADPVATEAICEFLYEKVGAYLSDGAAGGSIILFIDKKRVAQQHVAISHQVRALQTQEKRRTWLTWALLATLVLLLVLVTAASLT